MAGQGVFRLPPALPVTQMQTFRIAVPLRTHWRKATCAEVRCDAYLRGWVTAVDEGTELGQRQAHYIRTSSGRGFTEERRPDGLTYFVFEPGQQGFAGGDPAADHSRHRVRLDKQELFVQRGGDWRGNPTGLVRRHSPQGWVDAFGENQERIAELARRG